MHRSISSFVPTEEPPQTEIERRMPSGIFFRAWKPAIPSKKAIVFFHRGHEHSVRLRKIIEELHLEDAWIFAWDARGHGKTKLPMESFDQVVEDIGSFVDSITIEYQIPKENIALVAHSFSAVAVAEYVRCCKSSVNSIVLLAPAFRINLVMPFAYQALSLVRMIMPSTQIRSYVSGAMLTRSKEEARSYDKDKSITRTILVKVLLELRETAIRVTKRAQEIKTPSLLLIPECDFVVKRKEQNEFFENLGSMSKQMKTFPGMRHDVFHDTDTDKLIDEMTAFLRQQLQLETTCTTKNS